MQFSEASVPACERTCQTVLWLLWSNQTCKKASQAFCTHCNMSNARHVRRNVPKCQPARVEIRSCGVVGASSCKMFAAQLFVSIDDACALRCLIQPGTAQTATLLQ